MPVTWDRHTPAPGSTGGSLNIHDNATEPTPTFELSELASGDGFGEGEGERTVITAAAPYDLRPKFTGRAAAIEQLEQLIDSAWKEGRLAFAVVVGEPGMGKSRILGEVIARAKAKHTNLHVLQGVADENAHAYGPIARALTVRFGLQPGEDPAESRDKIQAGVAEVVPASRVTEIAHLIAHLLRVPFDDSPVITPLLDSPQRLEARLFMALKRMMTAEAEQHPVVIVVENLELCGTDTINFLQYLAAGMRDQRVALLGTATSALWQRHAAFGEGEVPPTKVELGPLTPQESEQLLRELCKQLSEVPPRLIAHVKTLGGSPRAIHELVRLLLENNVIAREGYLWRLDAAKLASMTMPKTYEELVAARLRVMEATERRVLEMAAVVGETSWIDAIIALERSNQPIKDPDGPTLAQIAASGDHSRLSVVAAIGKLVEREWMSEVPQSSVSGEREVRFAYPNLWSIVYKSIDEARRRSYHAVVARWLELHPEGRTPSAQEEVGRHLALAGHPRDAALRYRRAAEAARAQFANERAIRLYDRALACIGEHDHSTRIYLWHDLGSIYELIGDFEAALGAFERMLRLSWVAASKTKAAVAFNKMGRVWRRKGDLKLALEYLERGLELFRGASDARGIAGSLDDIGKTLQMLGRYDEAHAKITEALARRGKRGDKRAIATSLSRLGDVQQDRGQYESAYNCHKEALELRKQTGDRWGCVVSQNNLAALAFELGDIAEARSTWLAALPEADAIGALPLESLILTNLGEVALVEGKLDEARTRLENALEIIEDVEDRGLESECNRHLASLEKQQGQPQAAREHAERALEIAKKAGLREKEAQAYMTLGDVLSASLYDAEDAQTATTDAAVAYGKAIDVLREIGNETALGKALFAFGRYKAETGSIAAGKDMLRDAITLFAKLGLSRPAGEAEKLLASLS
ncbi:MAG TPA: tetratricopeptide repeat protein [Kofleriaceae bacterium]|nr:tetratricopeptide repeat protein [Kofleriaceae bacterium]